MYHVSIVHAKCINKVCCFGISFVDFYFILAFCRSSTLYYSTLHHIMCAGHYLDSDLYRGHFLNRDTHTYTKVNIANRDLTETKTKIY